MDDWGSPWADDAGASQLSSPPTAAPVESEFSSPNPILEPQSAGSVLASLERSSPWADNGALGEWASVESLAAPPLDAFPDWSSDGPTSITLPLDKKEEVSVDVQREVKPFWRSEAGLPLNTVETDPNWKSRISHPALATEPAFSIARANAEIAFESQADREIEAVSRDLETVDTPREFLVPTALPADWRNQSSTDGADHHTGLPLEGIIEEGNLPPRPPSSLAGEKCMEAGTAESLMTSFEEIDLPEEQILRPSSPQRPIPASADPISSQGQDAAGDSEDDFGEFEETKYTEADRNITRNPVNLELLGGIRTTLASPTPRINLDITSFEIDMSLMDQLIPQCHSSDIPPDIGDDVISSTSSRKAWYRMSRKETLREQNGGSGDYVRVTWVGSSIQANTIKIVARWITEDRITGGVILGGGNRLGAMFGWGEGAQGVPGKPQVGPRKDLAPAGLRSKASPSKITPGPLSPVTSQLTVSSAINSPKEDVISSNMMHEANKPVPQFGWSSFNDWDKRPALDTSRSTTSAHQRAVSMTPISPISSLGSPGVMPYPPPRSRPASLDLSKRRMSESPQMRGSDDISLRSNKQRLQETGAAQAAIQLASPVSHGNSPVRGGSQYADGVGFNPSGEQQNSWPSADLSIFDGRPLTEVPQFMPLHLREFGALDVHKSSKEATEDEIAEVDRAIKRLPNLAYMLR